MMSDNRSLVVRKADARGTTDFGWLKSRHSFSFGDYYDSAHMGFRSLRVINQDRVAPGGGFPTHPHRDMEIFSYVFEGALAHKDSMGNGRILKPGQIQLMSAGAGVTHSEFNPSDKDGLHFLQIWIQPSRQGLAPSYTEWHPRAEDAQSSKVLVISPDGRDRSAVIQQDAFVYRLQMETGETITHNLAPERGLWLQVIAGTVALAGCILTPGDGVASETAGTHAITAQAVTEALLFDLGSI
ncbi:MAG: pirin family protein [Kiritimatiellia bacterium]